MEALKTEQRNPEQPELKHKMSAELNQIARDRSLSVVRVFFNSALALLCIIVFYQGHAPVPVYVMIVYNISILLFNYNFRRQAAKPFIFKTLKEKYRYSTSHYNAKLYSIGAAYLLLLLMQMTYLRTDFQTPILKPAPLLILFGSIPVLFLSYFIYRLKLRHEMFYGRL